MIALVLALVLLATVLASSVISQLLPRLSLPLIQIACGIVVALVAHDQINVILNPDLFLVLFIAPLLFYEARESNKLQLWQNRGAMLSYAIGLVIAIVLIVGFVLHWFAPSIPLAACFALGAALGPTDPIAVASVSKQAEIPHRQRIILQGESLLNDASGIVSFQFSVAAVVTGTFSAVEAVGEFCLSFVGGLIGGIVLGFCLVKLADLVRGWGLENTTFHVSLEIITPFFAYLLAESVHVSGIIMVVACGIVMSLAPRSIDPSSSRMNIVSTSVWEVITFALNGIVFVMLGTQLPQAIGNIWINEGISNLDLVIIILIITVLMHGTRYVWTLVSEAYTFYRDKVEVTWKQRLHSAAVMTLAGSKGAITLAIMFSLPLYVNTGSSIQMFPQRDLLVFLASGVILLSLIIATFVVPLLAPRKTVADEDQHDVNRVKAQILRSVIEELTLRQTPENATAMRPVIEQYTERLERFKDEQDIQSESDKQLRLQVLEWEQEYVLSLIENDEVPPIVGYQVVNRIARLSSLIQHDAHKSVKIAQWFRRFAIVVRKLWNRLRGRLPQKLQRQKNQPAVVRDILARTYGYVIGRLQKMMKDSHYQTENIGRLIIEYQRMLRMLHGPSISVTDIARRAQLDQEASRLGLRLELEGIQQAYEDNLLTRAEAQNLRENVYLMQVDLEDYM